MSARRRFRSQEVGENTHPDGWFRLQITEDGKIVGDTGWRKNQITDLGAQHYLVEHLLGDTGNRKNVTHLAIGTGTSPGAAATTLDGEIGASSNRIQITANTTVVGSRTAQWTAQFGSAAYAASLPATIQNLGLYYTSNGGTLFAGQTFTTSQWNTNQDVNATYQVRFPAS
jgi:hypothetical protein